MTRDIVSRGDELMSGVGPVTLDTASAILPFFAIISGIIIGVFTTMVVSANSYLLKFLNYAGGITIILNGCSITH